MKKLNNTDKNSLYALLVGIVLGVLIYHTYPSKPDEARAYKDGCLDGIMTSVIDLSTSSCGDLYKTYKEKNP